MPYPNEHSCRIKNPDLFQKDSFKRIEGGTKEGKGPRDGKKLSIIIGRLKGETTTTNQAFRYPIGTWTELQARTHCKENEGTFEAATREKVKEATERLKKAISKK